MIVRRSGLDHILNDLRSKDIWYVWSSAWIALLWKSIIHCDILDDKTKWSNLESTDALGWIEYCILPHWWKEKYRKQFENIFDLVDLPAPLLLMEDTYYITM